jgi:potassium efflux system protein
MFEKTACLVACPGVCVPPLFRTSMNAVFCVVMWFCLATVSAVALEAAPSSSGQSQEAPQSLISPFAVEPEPSGIERIRSELESLVKDFPRRVSELSQTRITAAMVEQAKLDVQVADIQGESIGLDIAHARRRIQEIEQGIRELEAQQQWLANPLRGETAGAARADELERVRGTLEQQWRRLALEKDRLNRLRQYRELTDLRSYLAKQWLSRITEVFRLQQEQDRQLAEEVREGRLQEKLQGYLREAAELRNQLLQPSDSLSEAERRRLQGRIDVAALWARLLQHDIRLSSIESDLTRYRAEASREDAQPRTLRAALENLHALTDELRATQRLFEEGQPLAERQQRLMGQRPSSSESSGPLRATEQEAIEVFMAELEKRREWIEHQLASAQAIEASLQENYQASVRGALTMRSQLPQNQEQWQQLLEHLIDTPRAVLYQVTLSIQTAARTLINAEPVRWVGLSAGTFVLLWMTIWARRMLRRGGRAAAAWDITSFIGKASLALLNVIRKSLVEVALVTAILLLLWTAQVPQPGRDIIAALVLLWISIKLFLSLVHQLLASLPLTAKGRQHSALLGRLRWIVILGGILGSLTLLTHLSSLPEDVRDALDRLFMLYLVLAFPASLQLSGFISELLSEPYGHRLWFKTLRGVTVVLALALFVTGLLGLIGYLNLAWTFAWHLGVFLVVMVGWQIARGLLYDLVVFLKNFAVVHSQYGLLWTQDIIAPLHRVFELLLFLSAGLVLFALYGLEGDGNVIGTARESLETPLFSVGGTEINVWRILLTVVILFGVIGLGRWIRGITYRWIFGRIQDLGIRHSLSVFIQYVIVLIGLLMVIRTIGVNLTALTVFAGAVGVGIGFGLQTIANNFMSGLLLLIERPLRSGDIVKIGDNEGTVSRIGMRSLTIKTFDNLEVMIPNSDVVTNSFTNWTHSDSIVRTVLMLRVSYDAAPEQVKQILEHIVSDHPAIVEEPPPLVLLWEFAESGVRFWVQYYVDVNGHSLFTTRSEVNLALWHALQEAGIRIPYPQQDLHIKEWPERDAVRTQSSAGVAEAAWGEQALRTSP